MTKITSINFCKCADTVSKLTSEMSGMLPLTIALATHRAFATGSGGAHLPIPGGGSEPSGSRSTVGWLMLI